jgi:hypothetical protein
MSSIEYIPLSTDSHLFLPNRSKFYLILMEIIKNVATLITCYLYARSDSSEGGVLHQSSIRSLVFYGSEKFDFVMLETTLQPSPEDVPRSSRLQLYHRGPVMNTHDPKMLPPNYQLNHNETPEKM